MVEIPRESRRRLCRGFVTCGRCGYTEWNPRDDQVAWRKFELDEPFFTICDDRIPGLVPAFDLYRGIPVPHVYVRQRSSGEIVSYSSFGNCCGDFTTEELASFIPLGPPRANSFAVPESLAE